MTVHIADLTGHADRFWSRVARTDDDGCWDWQRGTTGRGYGQFAIPRGDGTHATVLSHRAALMLSTAADLPPDVVVDHRCERPICCNPSHLAVTDNATNVQAGKNGRAIELLPSGRFKVRFRQSRDGRRVQTSRTFNLEVEAVAFAESLSAAYPTPPRIKVAS